MKNILFTILFILFTSTLLPQTIVDMAGERLGTHRKNGAYYIKDINNYMQPYLGTWSYTNGNNEFRITLTKDIMYHDVYPDYNIDYYIDGLRIQYQKYDNGVLTYTSNFDEYPTGIIKQFGKLNMSFTDNERNNESFPLDLILISTSTVNTYNLRFKLDKFERRNTYYEEHPDEPYFSVPNDIIMTKL
ncbi:DUF6705 family protein [Psychroserpens damuponensis]|uniref:DUF6705 family protein n=1 Tax=Psychroserpens damuponensis TaxID=943936 RepID=UPI001269B392|nr:DUF6705 family protein [Psychroserpens damuponensis]